ncbi:MAG: hypothetical protein OXG24_06720 [Gammaproteobacteria bacterium]|nr:hypothetical protein [Gammaproteobacteria bacterium]
MSTSKQIEAVAYFRSLLRPIYRKRRFIHVAEVDAGLFGTASILEELGALNPFLLAGNRGTTKSQFPGEAEICTLNVQGATIVETARRFEAMLSNLPPAIEDRINRWDPDLSAQWVCAAMLSEISLVSGRIKYGRRKPEWTALENKTTIDGFWDYAGIEHSQSRVVGLQDPNLNEAAMCLDSGLGTVWSADNRDGVHGGATGIRWLKRIREIETLVREMGEFANSVRISPFLEGIPMSIHGIVFPKYVAVFRPVELITLRFKNQNQFLWAGCSTGYDPSDCDRFEMRRIARNVGNCLRESVNYRGPFSIDGILTESGFTPTELNPRMSGGFGALTRGFSGLPLAPLCWSVIEDEPLDFRPSLLEQAILEAADSSRVFGGHVVTLRRFDEVIELGLVRDGEDYREALPNEVPVVQLTCGPSPVGGIVFVRLAESVTNTGLLVAPEMVRALRYCDERFATGFGELECAREMRSTATN